LIAALGTTSYSAAVQMIESAAESEIGPSGSHLREAPQSHPARTHLGDGTQRPSGAGSDRPATPPHDQRGDHRPTPDADPRNSRSTPEAKAGHQVEPADTHPDLRGLERAGTGVPGGGLCRLLRRFHAGDLLVEPGGNRCLFGVDRGRRLVRNYPRMKRVVS